jgi:ABC-type nickel/cobalt efflux system permease component RcnA
MGNFAICHYSRIEAQPDGSFHLRYVLDRAEIPTVTEKKALDADGNGVITDSEKAAYLAGQRELLIPNLQLEVGGTPAALSVTGSDLRLSPGAGGLETLRVTLEMEARPAGGAPAGPVSVHYRDDSYPMRTGWKEIIAVGAGGARIANATVPATDHSAGLTVYPRDVVPPQDTEAQFDVTWGAGPGGAAAAAAPTSSGSMPTPSDRFTQSIAEVHLTPLLIVLGILAAFVYGGFHALGPGHGKTMVAAYLVGTRGTPRHALLLGVIVTITHTLGVFALGLATLFASKYVVPERLYPVLSALSGMSIFGVGIYLLSTRLRSASATVHAHAHDHSHDHHHHHHDHEHADASDHTHFDWHAHYDHDLHSHDHGHASHSHDLDDHHGHDHSFGYHTHEIPEGPVTPKALLALGVSGGLVPCPSALIVLLSAIALHRLAYGLVLITAFSLGLASVLIAIGLAVVSARGWLERLPASRRVGASLRLGDSRARTLLLRGLPVASAAAVTLIGLALTLRALVPDAAP